jgi:hypothetical protein
MIRGAAASSTTNVNGGVLLFYVSENSLVLTERMRITSIGNVGIGTTSPAAILDVRDTMRVSGEGINFGSSANDVTLSSIVYTNNTGGIDVKSLAKLGLYTGGTERLHITSGGNTQPGADNSYSLGASGIRWSAVWAANGTIQTSDEREKKDIIDADLGLNFILKLRPVSFKWKVGKNIITNEIDGVDDEGKQKVKSITKPIEGKRRHYGLLAQEVKEVLGDIDFGGFIHDIETNIMGLRYDQFIPILIKGIKEQQIQIQEQNEIIKVLEQRIINIETN